ncbi:MAG: response regulator [Burkholderiales bacterium]|nr:response regulator [Phycisphaerae bacterium]
MILIIDDAPDLRAMFQALLANAGFPVRTAATAADGLTIALTQKPKLILLDICMPGMDGFGFIRAVHKIECLRDVKIIILSGMDSTVTKEKAAALGVEHVFIKGKFEIIELLSLVDQLVAQPAGAESSGKDASTAIS